MSLRIIFRLLRIGQRQQRPLEPERWPTLQVLARLDAGAEHLEAAVLVQEQAADADLDRRAALAAGREDVRRRRRIGAKRANRETQRHREERKGDETGVYGLNE